jgi:hypothetical protein
MDEAGIEEFKRDFIIKTQVQEVQFEQWLTIFFYLNNELILKYDFIHQEMFYIKLSELMTEGHEFAAKILKYLENGINIEKHNWYLKLFEGLNKIRAMLSNSEFEYIQYRRHNSCHIHQNSFEHIQENLKIKKNRNGKDLSEINNELKSIILKHGSDKNFDFYFNEKFQLIISDLYKNLTIK